MNSRLYARIAGLLRALAAAGLLAGCGQKKEQRDPQAIIEEMAVDYGTYGSEADERIGALKTVADWADYVSQRISDQDDRYVPPTDEEREKWYYH